MASCSCTSGMVSKVGCSATSAMVGRAQVYWGFGSGWRFGVSLHLGRDVGWFILVASSGLFSGLEHGGCQILRLNSQSYVAPNMKVWVKGHRRGCERG
jgi:hypothetical protein